MNLGESFYNARKKKGMSQEEVAEKLGVSRQTISKWETNETLPDIRQSKNLAVLYGVSLDDLFSFDINLQEIQDVIDKTSEETNRKIDWSKAWSRKYPILATYQKEVDTAYYDAQLYRLYKNLQETYGYSDLDAFLVLKDILGAVWNRIHPTK